MNYTKVQIKERVKNLGGHVNDEITVAVFPFNEKVSNDGGESITLTSAMNTETQMMGMGFDGALIGSELDESDLNCLRFDI